MPCWGYAIKPLEPGGSRIERVSRPLDGPQKRDIRRVAFRRLKRSSLETWLIVHPDGLGAGHLQALKTPEASSRLQECRRFCFDRPMHRVAT
jgi:hypothetical protein